MGSKLKWIIPITIFVVSLIILFRPAGRITFDKSVSENRIVYKYEIFGCGSVIGKVIDGGEEITAKFKEQYPDIGINEVVFSNGSDEPRKHMDAAEFSCGGLAERYIYVIEGSPIGVTRGAPDCCDPSPAYNENVVEFKVDKWYFTSYVPYAEVGNFGVIFFTFTAMAISIVWLFLLITITFFKYVIIKYKNSRK